MEIPWIQDVVRAKKPKRLPVVLTPEEVARLIGRMDKSTALIVSPSDRI